MARESHKRETRNHPTQATRTAVALLAVIAAVGIYFVVRDVRDRQTPDPAGEARRRLEREGLERVDRIIDGMLPVHGR